MTAEAYIRGFFPTAIPDSALASIFLNRGITASSETTEVASQLLRLAYADVCMYIAKSPSQYTGVKDSDNGWSHSEGSVSYSQSDKDALRKEANTIYREYNDPAFSSGIKIQNLHGRPYYGS